MSTQSIADRIVAAAVARLNLAAVPTAAGMLAKPAALTVERSRARPVQPRETFAGGTVLASVYRGVTTSRRAPHERGPLHLHGMVLHVQVVAPIGEDDAFDAVLDPYVVWVLTALLTDQRLGGLAIQLDEFKQTPSTGPMEQDPDRIYGSMALELMVHFQTTVGDPTRTA